jgi:ABC-type polar amino acid transport system ATPase subunit
MISEIHIDNFRCFKQLRLKSLKRFCFLVGESGTGKTALLEAMFLAGGGSPEIWFRIRRWRGLGEGPIELNVRASYEALFRDMFYDFEQKLGANITIFDPNKGKRELSIRYENAEVYTLPLKGGSTENAMAIDPITFKWITGRNVYRSQVEFKDGALRMTGSVEVYPVFLISPQTFSARANAQYYSNLSRLKKALPVLAAVQSIFNDVEDLTLEIIAGEPVIHVSIARMDEKLPLGNLSGGVNKYISIILAILTNPGGIVLIDEIENGFYYKNLPDLLRNIVQLCEDHDVQLIATTHSYEFLQVLAEVMGESERRTKNCALFRLERGKEQPSIEQVPGDSYEAAIKQNFEVR